MCNYIKANNEQCKLSPKKERCHKHLIKEEIVSTNIEKLSVMIHSSPIEVVDITVDSVIAPTESSSVNVNVVPEQVSSVEKPSADSTVYMTNDTLPKKLIIFNPVADQWAFKNLSTLAEGVTHCSGPHPTSKRPGKISIGNEIFEYEFCARVEAVGFDKRAFFWFLSADDMLRFNNSAVSKYQNVEIHQIIWANGVSFFVDLDWEMSIKDLVEDFENIQEAQDFALDAFRSAITEHNQAVSINSPMLKFAVSQRSRKTVSGCKISLHIYTNIAMKISELNAFLDGVVSIIRRRPDSWIKSMLKGVDSAQYHLNGSLALPGGTKKGYKSVLIVGDIYPLINSVSNGPYTKYLSDDDVYDSDACESENSDADDDDESASIGSRDDNDFIKEAFNNVKNIDGYEAFDFSMRKRFGKGGYRINRKLPSFCTMCNRRHDNDNTLIISINKRKLFATWRCAKADTAVKSKLFYKRESSDSRPKKSQLDLLKDDLFDIVCDKYKRGMEPVLSMRRS